MPNQLPWPLLSAWILFFVPGVAQFHHERLIRRDSPYSTGVLKVVEVSQLLWLLAAVGILIYYAVVSRWYWPLVLAIPGSMAAALIAGILFSVLGERLTSVLGLIVWPSAAGWALWIIRSLPAA